jgi:hypothetical protein
MVDRPSPTMQIDVRPRERDDFTQAQSRVATQEHHAIRLSTTPLGHFQQPFVLVDVVKSRRLLRRGQELNRARQVLDHAYSTAFFNNVLKIVSTWLTVWGRCSC